jgi:hypothetical protein
VNFVIFTYQAATATGQNLQFARLVGRIAFGILFEPMV